MSSDRSMDQLIERFTAWGAATPNVRLMALFGSHARADHPADQWSDLDLLVVADDPWPYLGSSDWLAQIGPVRLTFLESTPLGDQFHRQVLFEDGSDVDMPFLPAAVVRQHLADLPNEARIVFRRGVRVLLDKDGVGERFTQLATTPPAPPQPPTRDAFRQVVHGFLYHAVWTAKKVRRGELWPATHSCNNHMSSRLLQMMEWHTRATKGWSVDTWHSGRLLESWADPRVVQDLHSAFAAYDAADLGRALQASLTLFGWMAGEVAERLGYDYPAEAHRYTMEWVAEPHMSSDHSMSQLIERFTAWGARNPNIRLIAVFGSHARTDRPADQWSDLDLLVVVNDPQPYLDSSDWLAQIGPMRLTFLEPTPAGDQLQRRVLFDDASDVDMSFLPAAIARQLLAADLPDEMKIVLGRGVRVVLDKDGIGRRFAQPAAIPRAVARPPAREAFRQVIHDYLYHAIWTAKKVRRGELWPATHCCNYHMASRLLQMIEWHAGTTRGWSVDTWYDGRFLESWADPRALQDLRGAFAAYDAAELRRAVLASLALFGWLAGEIAERLGYDYPAEVHRYTVGWVTECLRA